MVYRRKSPRCPVILLEALNKLSREILKSPEDYSLRIVLSAAEYMAENTSINLPPMLGEEEDLGLQVHL